MLSSPPPGKNGRKISRRTAIQLGALGTAALIAAPAYYGGRIAAERAGMFLPDRAVWAEEPTNSTASNPLLLLYGDDNGASYAAVWRELMLVEGFPWIDAMAHSSLSIEVLRAAACVIALPGEYSDQTCSLLQEYVEGGGGLLTVLPRGRLAAISGVVEEEAPGEQLSSAYFVTNGSHSLAKGIHAGAMQYHADALAYGLAHAEAIAWLCDSSGSPSDYPAVTWSPASTAAGGAVASWTFDLARSIVAMRQGPLSQIDQEIDGIDGIRACERFDGFIDLDKIHIPQADEALRLMANVVTALSASTMPLPRLWYFQRNANTTLVATGDSHNNPPEAIDSVLRRLEEAGGAMSIYFTPDISDPVRRSARRLKGWASTLPTISELLGESSAVTEANVAAWRSSGHEFALHPFVEDGLVEGWSRYWYQWHGLGFGPFRTTRTHRVLWSGWTTTAAVQARFGIDMNCDFYHVGPTFQKADGTWTYGYFTGSGLPMRFVDTDGQLLRTWQQLTNIVDEQLIEMPWGAPPDNESLAHAIAVVETLIGNATKGFYSALGAQFHFDPFAVEGPWMAGANAFLSSVLDICRREGVPIQSAESWVGFVNDRASIQLESAHWESETGRLTWKFPPEIVPADLTVLFPLHVTEGTLSSVSVDGVQIDHTDRQLGSTLYACVVLPQGAQNVLAEWL